MKKISMDYRLQMIEFEGSCRYSVKVDETSNLINTRYLISK